MDVLILKERASIIMQMMKACLLIFGYHFSISLTLIENQVIKKNMEKKYKENATVLQRLQKTKNFKKICHH